MTQEDYADMNYTGYRVGSSVTHHSANGVGAYTYFRDHSPVTVKSGFVVPDAPNVVINNAFTFFLYCGPDASKCGISIENVINDVGGAITMWPRSKYVCQYYNGNYILGDED